MEERNIVEEVQTKLDEIEKSKNVRILYSCEGGSQAWGFASTNSDWDIRGIYVHPQDYYLDINVEDKSDTIEVPIEKDLDCSFWDLRKALKLLRKSNPSLLEHLHSPIVYREVGTLCQELREALVPLYNAKASLYHFIHMASGNYREYLHGSEVALKKYLYVLRPLLAVQYIEKGLGIVPVEFQKIIDSTLSAGSPLRIAIEELVARKRAGEELGKGNKIVVISEFINNEIERHKNISFKGPERDGPSHANNDELNRIFKKYIKET